MRMTKAIKKNDDTPGLDVRRGAGPLTGIIVLLVGLMMLGTFCVVGDVLEDGFTLSQQDIALSCQKPSTVRLSLPDPSKEGEAAWILAAFVFGSDAGAGNGGSPAPRLAFAAMQRRRQGPRSQDQRKCTSKNDTARPQAISACFRSWTDALCSFTKA